MAHMPEVLKVIREWTMPTYRVVAVAHPEHTAPEDTVAWDDPDREKEYCEKIYSGEYPWYVLGVHVFAGDTFLGSSYLGCVDTYELRDVGVRDVAGGAIEEARERLDELLENARYGRDR